MIAEQSTITPEQTSGVVLIICLLAFCLGLVIFFISALISVLGSSNLTAGGKALWILVVFAFPFLGPLGWFIWGRQKGTYRTDVGS
ncbi:PLD nuclease N-terminal domain-containing protein [Psychromicrobium sp. YIM B11713]|uniref:PLD nuclease N-terminal domain-containing protein n=1 Tax=Psychromicrobium sp. YIM B11713 TaxID=3145233 RepID=UPI00374F13C1